MHAVALAPSDLGPDLRQPNDRTPPLLRSAWVGSYGVRRHRHQRRQGPLRGSRPVDVRRQESPGGRGACAGGWIASGGRCALIMAIKEMNAAGVPFVSMGENINTVSPTGRLLLGPKPS